MAFDFTHIHHTLYLSLVFFCQKFVMDRLDAAIFAVLTACMPKFKSYSYLQYVYVCINSQVFLCK